MKFNPGDKYHICCGYYGFRPYLIHVLAIVDNNMIVIKWYGKHKQWWHYEVLSDWELEDKIKFCKEHNK